MSLPKEILFEKYADIGFFWQGQVSTDTLSRLKDSLQTPSTLEVSCRLEKKEGIVWLSFVVQGSLMLSCHRCLSPMVLDVSDEYRTAILFNESQVVFVEDEEYIFASELGDTRYLPLLDLLEDELLLVLPLSSTHSDCELLVDTVGEIVVEEPQENPFAVLAQLKTKN